MSDAAYDPDPAALPADLLQAFVAHSRDLLAVSDGTGTVLWANRRFAGATGYAGRPATTLLDFTPPGASGSASRLSFARMLSSPGADSGTLELRGPDGAAFWVDAHCSRLGSHVLWTLTDVTRTRALATRATRQEELLETAQEFGRVGIWEREIPSGEGRWDKHVFGFWGIDPAEGTPSYLDATERIHPQDRARMLYTESTRRAGRYAQRYRVVHPDGKTRWIHSQWEVKNGPRGVPNRAVGVMMDDTEAYDAARTLSDINAQLKMAVDLGGIAISRYDLRTRRMYYNDRALEFLGVAPRAEGLSLDEVRSFIHPDDLATVRESARQALSSRAPTDMEARYRRHDGSWRYVLTRHVVERNAAGEPLAFIGVALDRTESVEHLRHAEELARRLDAASRAAGVGIWTTTAEPGEVDWNLQMFEIFDRHEAPTPPSFRRWISESVHPDDRERVARHTRVYFASGDQPFEVELRILRKDGSVRWVVMRADIDRVHSDRRRILGVAMDVTEHHRALDALREASQRTALITRHAGIGTWQTDGDGSCESWDAQMFQLRGLVPADRPPNHAERAALVHPDDLPRVLDSLAAMPATHLPAAYEFRVRLPDGSYRWLASRSAVVLDDTGKPARRVGVNWDVSESKSAEMARQQAALAEREIQAKSQFLSRMSHELRTPLNAVLGFTQLLQIEARNERDADQLAKLGHIRAAGDHLLSLINDVLDLSGLEAGEVRLSLQTVDLGALVRQSLPLLQSLAEQHGVALVADTTDGLACADPTRLRQVLINLLSNAIKYNRRGGKVVIATGDDGATATLTVRDTGRGLSAAQIGALFEPFNRFGVEHEGIEGTGIGLTIVKSLVDGMKGRIDVASEPGNGTLFTVSLPAASAPPAPIALAPEIAPAPVPASANDVAGRRATILYIEDNQVNVLLVEELVKSLGGLAIVSELSGAAGVARAVALRPDLVLIDLQLPDFDGYEVLRRLRADPRTRAIPCVALSANAMREDIDRGLASGFADYWTKPIDFAVFIAALERMFPATARAAEEPAVAEPVPGK
jgi:PAS domain S-box-containing protein